MSDCIKKTNPSIVTNVTLVCDDDFNKKSFMGGKNIYKFRCNPHLVKYKLYTNQTGFTLPEEPKRRSKSNKTIDVF